MPSHGYGRSFLWDSSLGVWSAMAPWNPRRLRWSSPWDALQTSSTFSSAPPLHQPSLPSYAWRLDAADFTTFGAAFSALRSRRSFGSPDFPSHGRPSGPSPPWSFRGRRYLITFKGVSSSG